MPAAPVVHHTVRGTYGTPEAGTCVRRIPTVVSCYPPARASCPRPPVRTARSRLVRAARTHSRRPRDVGVSLGSTRPRCVLCESWLYRSALARCVALASLASHAGWLRYDGLMRQAASIPRKIGK